MVLQVVPAGHPLLDPGVVPALELPQRVVVLVAAVLVVALAAVVAVVALALVVAAAAVTAFDGAQLVT